MIRNLHIVLFSVMFAGCSGSSTHMLSSWKDPGASQVRFEKVAVIAGTEKDDVRKQAEDQLTRIIPRSHSTYEMLTVKQLKNVPEARQTLQAAGFDGALVLKLVEKTVDVSYVPSSALDDYSWGDYDWDMGGTKVQRKAVVIETKVFSVKDNRLLWSGKSKTVDPLSLRQALPDIISAAAERMRADGLIN